jgi:hypothetical protein
MNRRLIALAIGIPAVALGWYLFRPELLFVNKSVNETFPVVTTAGTPSASPERALAVGQFRGIAHETKGTATIYQVGDRRVLRLSGFETSNGPDVRVLLVAAPDAADNETVKSAGSVELGKLKGNVGDQNYDVPAGVDLATYRAVTIWCNRFGVNFGTAPLQPGGSAASSGGLGGDPVALSSGQFRGIAHETKGTATIYQVGGGKRVLRLSGFETSNGPDVRVLLVAAPDAGDNDTVKSAGYVELGKLKGNVGDQNYDVPANVDLATYRAVTIWCNRFGVNFGTAPLNS